MAKINNRGLPPLGQHGWYGIQDGGASSVVVGHITLMHVVGYMKYRGVSPDRFLFMPANKTFSFGGDASRQADWSVRFPVYTNGKSGYMECFVVDGSTPLLVGRPILQALNVEMNFKDREMSIKDSPWFDVR